MEVWFQDKQTVVIELGKFLFQCTNQREILGQLFQKGSAAWTTLNFYSWVKKKTWIFEEKIKGSLTVIAK